MLRGFFKVILYFIVFFCFRSAMAQEIVAQRQISPDSLANEIGKIRNEQTAAKHLKFSGWVQAQFQLADHRGIETYAGGSNFNANVDNRFSVRRGRFKIVYDNGLSLCNFQIDISERNVQLREMFVKLKDPWTKTTSLTVGMFNRPFGYEISYSSSLRETPERGRMSQAIFFNERDLGAWLNFQAPESSPLHFLKFDAALVSGTGITNVNNIGAAIADPNKNTQNNISGGNDFDFKKDFIGRVSAQNKNKSGKFSLSGGLSYYNGGYRMGNKQVWTDNGAGGFKQDTSLSNIGSIAKRMHYGADVQITMELPFGITTLRGEYITGQMPGLGYRTFNSTPYSQPITPIYFRNFSGAYFYFVQRLGKTKHQVVFKYDWYDPNTKVKGSGIGALGSNTTAVDIRFDTFGVGYLYYWDSNVKLSLYYDIVKNEKTQIAGASILNDYRKDIQDNVITVRVQYKF
jgi:hypothetical protein